MTSGTGHFDFHRTPAAVANQMGLTLASLDALIAYAKRPNAYEKRSINIHGRQRQLLIPDSYLMEGQRRVARLLHPALVDLHPSCCGFRPGGSTYLNALPHCGQRWVQKLDIKDFFPSTTRSQVETALQRIGVDRVSATKIAELATTSSGLPLGAPTSPAISNLVLSDFDSRMAEIAAASGITYTRYADDLTFSSNDPFDLEAQVEAELRLDGYRLNPEKSRLRRRGQKIYVTGLAVSEKTPRLPKQVKRRLRQELYFIENRGFENHAETVYSWPFYDEADADRQIEHSLRHVRGKVRYALGIEPDFTWKLLSSFPDAKALLVREPGQVSVPRSIYVSLLADAIRSRSEGKPPFYRETGT